jgi:DNA-binding IclR family transcriptional regulator
VLDPSDRAVAAISVSGPAARITPNRFQSVGKSVMKAAD